MTQFTEEECKALIQFFDRTPITGHGERQAMNLLVQKAAQISLEMKAGSDALEAADPSTGNPEITENA